MPNFLNESEIYIHAHIINYMCNFSCVVCKILQQLISINTDPYLYKYYLPCMLKQKPPQINTGLVQERGFASVSNTRSQNTGQVPSRGGGIYHTRPLAGSVFLVQSHAQTSANALQLLPSFNPMTQKGNKPKLQVEKTHSKEDAAIYMYVHTVCVVLRALMQSGDSTASRARKETEAWACVGYMQGITVTLLCYAFYTVLVQQAYSQHLHVIRVHIHVESQEKFNVKSSLWAGKLHEELKKAWR